MYISFRIIGQNIRKARKEKQLTQEEAAELLDMSLLHYGRLERGERCVSLEQLARIADTLSVPTFSLLNGCLLHEPLSAMPTSESTGFADALARMTSACTAQELEMITEICKVVSRQKKSSPAKEKDPVQLG